MVKPEVYLEPSGSRVYALTIMPDYLHTLFLAQGHWLSILVHVRACYQDCLGKMQFSRPDPRDSDSVDLECGSGIFMFSKCPGDSNASCPGITLREILLLT